ILARRPDSPPGSCRAATRRLPLLPALRANRSGRCPRAVSFVGARALAAPEAGLVAPAPTSLVPRRALAGDQGSQQPAVGCAVEATGVAVRDGAHRERPGHATLGFRPLYTELSPEAFGGNAPGRPPGEGSTQGPGGYLGQRAGAAVGTDGIAGRPSAG